MFLYFIVAVLAVAAFHIFVFHQYNYPWTVKLINKIPGPDGVFYFGSTMRFWNLKSEDRLEEISNMFKIYGPTYRYWFSGVPTVFISELDDYQTVLSCRLNSYKGIMYKHIRPWLGQGLLTNSGNSWHIRRKIITPTFHFAILQNFVNIFNKNTKFMLGKLQDCASKQNIVDFSPYVTCCTLDNVCETAMGTSVNSQSGAFSKYVTCVFRMGAIVAERMFSPVLFPDVNFSLSPVGKEHQELLKFLHGFTNKVIEKCKITKASSLRQGEALEGANRDKLTFLQLLLDKQTEYRLTDQDIREEVDTFMFEGHDTTSMGIIWTLFELGHHFDVQEKCWLELQTIFDASDRMPTHHDIKQMPYLKRVVQEALRLHPSVPVISRKFDIDIQLKDYVVPRGTEIVMCIYYLHRNPKIYPDPEKFDPDRFLQAAVNSRHSFSYLPFSAGLRNCVGQKFAILELLVVISSIIRKFKIETIGAREAVKSVPEMTLRPFQPISWRITPRS